MDGFLPKKRNIHSALPDIYSLFLQIYLSWGLYIKDMQLFVSDFFHLVTLFKGHPYCIISTSSFYTQILAHLI